MVIRMAAGGSEAEIMETSIEDTANNLLNKVARSDAHFKSQQRNEPDLTHHEKYAIANEILTKGPAQFLARFHKFLDRNDVPYFEQFRQENYEVDFYLKEIGSVTPKTNKLSVKNRRYEALKKLIQEGDYFSDFEMRRRNPLAFEHLIGRYMDQQEKDSLDTIDKADLRFSTILIEHMDRDYEKSLCIQQMEELSFKEEFDSDEDQSSEDESMDDPHTIPSITKDEKLLLRGEFLSLMHQNFLDGKDEDFDYSAVDNNADYDNIQVKQQDAEDGYFDAEEPHVLSAQAKDI